MPEVQRGDCVMKAHCGKAQLCIRVFILVGAACSVAPGTLADKSGTLRP
jgi:hypothetical protein